jgi:hypothetical protein
MGNTTKELAVVLMVTATVFVLPPAICAVGALQVALAGAPAHTKVTLPENPAPPSNCKL